nr:retrovirus-related Pol polyprotein from transposon TNT 1-94 [Tanacetum cinerariifolium]
MKNELIEFCGLKGIKREYSNARTSQQNRVAERKNMTLIEAARTMVLVTKPQNKIPYELLTGKQPIISSLRSFGCHVTILTTIDQLGKFDGKSDSGFLVGYSVNNKAFRVYNLETKRVEETLIPISTASPKRAFNDDKPLYPDDHSMPHLEDIYASLSEGIFTDSSYDDEGVVTNFNNLETTVYASPSPTSKIHTIHPKTQILRDPMLAVQTRSKLNKNSKARAFIFFLEIKQLGLNGSTGTRRMKGEL